MTAGETTAVFARYVPTDALPSEAPAGPRREWPSLAAWLADPDHYWWYPEPEEPQDAGDSAL